MTSAATAGAARRLAGRSAWAGASCMRRMASPSTMMGASTATMPARRTGWAQRGFAASSLRADKFYSTEHEWIDLSDDGTEGTVGVSTYAAKALGDVVFVELPAEDLVVSVDDALGAVESVKSASDIYAPAAGKVIATNAVLEDTPGTINKDPEGEGWIARIKLDEGEAERVRASLMTLEKYNEHTEAGE